MPTAKWFASLWLAEEAEAVAVDGKHLARPMLAEAVVAVVAS
jgi:hypothetical protein